LGRTLVEHAILAIAVSLLILLGISHVNFVSPKNNFPDCKLTKFDSKAHIVRLLIQERTKKTENMEYHDKIELVFSMDEGFLFLNDENRAKYKIKEDAINVFSDDSSCFGDKFQQTIMFNIFQNEEEALLTNFILQKYKFTGFVQNQRGKITNLSDYRGTRGDFWNKLGIIVSTLITFTTLNIVVEFTLKETQSKVVEFSYRLKEYVRTDTPVLSLITTHILNILLFIPLTIGLLYTLQWVVYRGDVYASFGVLSLVWFIRAFSIVCVRTHPSLHFFPRTQFLYYSLFHLYSQVYPHGFIRAALSVTTLFCVHSMVFFFHRYELPAVQAGAIHSARPRASIYHTHYNPNIVRRSFVGHDNVGVARSSRLSIHANGGNSNIAGRPPRPGTPTGASLSRSNSTTNTAGLSTGVSRASSTNSLMFNEDGVGDSEEYVVFLNGEVVLPARSAIVRRRSELS